MRVGWKVNKEKNLADKYLHSAGQGAKNANHFLIQTLLFTKVSLFLLWLISHITSSSCSLAWQRASWECSLLFQGQFLWRVHREQPLLAFVKKHFNEATDRWSSKEQGSIAGKWVTEPSAPFIQYSPSQFTDRAAETEKKGHLSNVYTRISVSHWPLSYSDVKQLLTPVLKPMQQWCNVCCINNPWDKHFITNSLYYLSIRELKKLWDLLWE